MSSLLEDPPLPARRRTLGHYLLPALVLLNVLLMLSLLGVLPPLFGDQPDPGRMERQIDAERVKVLPAGAGENARHDTRPGPAPGPGAR